MHKSIKVKNVEVFFFLPTCDPFFFSICFCGSGSILFDVNVFGEMSFSFASLPFLLYNFKSKIGYYLFSIDAIHVLRITILYSGQRWPALGD